MKRVVGTPVEVMATAAEVVAGRRAAAVEAEAQEGE
jgi:hypothetical protein